MRYLAEPSVEALESELAEFFGTTYAVVVSSGTASIYLALLALGVKNGDEVLVPSASVPMTVAAVLQAGAIPVFVDCQNESLQLDEADLKSRISSRTAGAVAVHLWGYSSHLRQLRALTQSRGIWLLEDACQAHGSTVSAKLLGTWGDVGCFSMHRSKILSTGEGGFLLTNSAVLHERASGFRTHWQVAGDIEKSYAAVGFNYRLSGPAAEVARAQLPLLRERIDARQLRASSISKALCQAIPGSRPYAIPEEEKPNGYSPVILLPQGSNGRTRLVDLARAGISNSVGTFGLRPAWRWPAFADHARRDSLASSSTDHFFERTLAPVLPPVPPHEDEATWFAETARDALLRGEDSPTMNGN